MSLTYRKGELEDFLRIIPELQKAVFGHWKIEPTITVKDDGDWVAFDISYPQQEIVPVYEGCELMDETVSLIGAFLDGYILGRTK